MINDFNLIKEACEQNKNCKYNTGILSFTQYHLQNALNLASLGYSVFPVSGYKIPYKGFRWKEFSTNDPKIISKYWQLHPYGRPAIDCEKSGITVVDVDNKPEKGKYGLQILENCLTNWGDFPKDTPIVISPSGGLHAYFKDSGKVLTRCYAECIDIQRPHYIVAPTSLNAQNGLYKIYNKILPQAELQYLPNEWLKQLTIQHTEVKYRKSFEPIKKKVLNIDIKPLLGRCEFITHCVEESETLSEFLWFEFAIFLSGIANGEELFHKYSEKYPTYNYDEAQSKFERSKKYHFSCQSIRDLFDGCKYCTKNKERKMKNV